MASDFSETVRRRPRMAPICHSMCHPCCRHSGSSDSCLGPRIPLDRPPQVDISFHGVDYLMTASTVNGDTLSVEVEQRSDASRWRGDFTSRCERMNYSGTSNCNAAARGMSTEAAYKADTRLPVVVFKLAHADMATLLHTHTHTLMHNAMGPLPLLQARIATRAAGRASHSPSAPQTMRMGACCAHAPMPTLYAHAHAVPKLPPPLDRNW